LSEWMLFLLLRHHHNVLVYSSLSHFLILITTRTHFTF
jgi:hypothetical protein